MPVSEKPSITPHNPSITKGRRASACNLLLLAVLILSLCSCATCRETAVKDAEYYMAEGKESRVAMYCVGTWGQIVGMGIWSSHVQAQVKVDDRWYWVNGIGDLQSAPAYSMRPFIVDNGTEWLTSTDYLWWPVETYKGMLNRKDEIEASGAKSPCDGDMSWWKWVLIGVIIL